MYSFSSKVRYSECDSSSQLTIPALINYFQDCSTFHTESIDRGIRYCAEQGFAWFIAAWQIQIVRLPSFTEEIRVITWSFAKKPTLANRHFLVENTDGEPLVMADSLWFPFDIKKGAPMRIPQSESIYLQDKSPLEMPPTQRKLRLTGEGETRPGITVASHHLDSNNHVNNGQYVGMADDIIRTHDASFAPRIIKVQYKLSATLGDEILPKLYIEDNGYAVDLANPNGASYAIVRMER